MSASKKRVTRQYLRPTLTTLVRSVDDHPALRRRDVGTGDMIYVRTLSSLYTITILADGSCAVSGGWFDAHGGSQSGLSIEGCSWGGTALCVNILAACGLSIEFGNRVRTSPVQKIILLPRSSLN